MLHPKSGKTIRAAIGGGKSIIPSNEKVSTLAGSELDISLHFKDAASVRTPLRLLRGTCPDAPKSDEIVMAVVLADAGRPHALVNGVGVSAVCRSPASQDGTTNFFPRV